MRDRKTRRRLLVAVAATLGSIAVGVPGLAGPAAASEAPLSAGATVGDLATVSVQAGLLRLGTTPPSPSDEPGEPTPQEPPCDIEEDPESCEEPPGEEPPGEDPDDPGDNPVCEINPDLCDDGESPGGGGDENPGSPDDPGPAPGPGVDEPPDPGSGPDDRGDDDCADGGLGCAPEGASEDQQGGAVPDTSSAGPELPDTGATGLLAIGVTGAVLIAVGGLMAIRHYQGRHRA